MSAIQTSAFLIWQRSGLRSTPRSEGRRSQARLERALLRRSGRMRTQNLHVNSMLELARELRG
jgi:hypothetical protein